MNSSPIQRQARLFRKRPVNKNEKPAINFNNSDNSSPMIDDKSTALSKFPLLMSTPERVRSGGSSSKLSSTRINLYENVESLNETIASPHVPSILKHQYNDDENEQDEEEKSFLTSTKAFAKANHILIEEEQTMKHVQQMRFEEMQMDQQQVMDEIDSNQFHSIQSGSFFDKQSQPQQQQQSLGKRQLIGEQVKKACIRATRVEMDGDLALQFAERVKVISENGAFSLVESIHTGDIGYVPTDSLIDIKLFICHLNQNNINNNHQQQLRLHLKY